MQLSRQKNVHHSWESRAKLLSIFEIFFFGQIKKWKMSAPLCAGTRVITLLLLSKQEHSDRAEPEHGRRFRVNTSRARVQAARAEKPIQKT